MAKLINGNGNKAIWAQQDADLIAALVGNVTGIAKVGNEFAATQEDANTIGLSDGVIVTKEGRRIQLDVGSVDLFDIPTGTAGVTSYYIIGYHLITNSDSSQTCETFVQKMDNATDVITENTFRGGATDVYVSCYRVVQDGLNIDSINALLPELENISTLMLDLGNKSSASSVSGNDAFSKINTLYDILHKGYVEVSGNGVKTYATLLNELYALVDISKISSTSKLEIVNSADSTYTYMNLCGVTTSQIQFSLAMVTTDGEYVGFNTLKSTGSKAVVGRLNAAVDISNTVPSASQKYRILY